MLCLSACATLPGDMLVDGPAGKAQISRLDAAPPAIVFESGLFSHKEGWNSVFSTVALSHTAFAYDRPGMGRSDATSRPRDGRTIVEDLRALLRNQRLPPPYVLVGHSAGGLYTQLFARMYPQEVAGIVLVDSTHPMQFVGEGAMSNRSEISQFVMALALTGAPKAEFDALNETGRQVLSAPPLQKEIPMVILIAPDRSATVDTAYDNAKRRDLGKLYPTAILREVDSNHDIPRHRPQVIIDAIAAVVRASARK